MEPAVRDSTLLLRGHRTLCGESHHPEICVDIVGPDDNASIYFRKDALFHLHSGETVRSDNTPNTRFFAHDRTTRTVVF
jgi:hypothetical protein